MGNPAEETYCYPNQLKVMNRRPIVNLISVLNHHRLRALAGSFAQYVLHALGAAGEGSETRFQAMANCLPCAGQPRLRQSECRGLISTAEVRCDQGVCLHFRGRLKGELVISFVGHDVRSA